MNFDFQALMAKATGLIRNNRLSEATAAIQRALGGAAAPAAKSFAAAGQAEALDVIDGSDLIDVIDVADVADVADVSDTGEPDAARTRTDRPGNDKTGHTLAGHHVEGHAGLDYKLFVPPQAGTRALPLVLMLHGCTQTADDFAAGTAMNEAARERGFYVLYPEQPARANSLRCWNWFKHNHQQRGRGEPALLAGLVNTVIGAHDVDRSRIFVAGLSAGGAMAAILGETHPELFAAVGVHSGLAAGAARDLPAALAAMRQGAVGLANGSAGSGLPTIVFHGDADATVHPANGKQVIAASAGRAATSSSERIQGQGNRASTRQVHRSVDGRVLAEHWVVHGSAHAWSGGSRSGSYTDPAGPDATREMLRFFFEHGRRH